MIPLVNFEVQAIAPYLVKERGWKKIALVYVDDPAGEAIQKELSVHVPKNGGTLVAELQVPRASQQFSGIAAKVREASARPRLHRVVRRPAGADRQAAARQRRHAAAGQLLGVLDSRRVRSCPRPRARCSRRQAIDWNGDALSQRVAKDWKAKTGKEPNAYVANYYNAVMVFAKLAQALEKAGQPITGEGPAEAAQARWRASTWSAASMEFLPNGTVVDAAADQRDRRRQRQGDEGDAVTLTARRNA